MDMNIEPSDVLDTSETLSEHDRRRRGAGNYAEDKGNISTTRLRRRAQNRASQRAFRERKEKHVKALEQQLSKLHEKHHDLLESYTRQADEIAKLNRIQELNSELDPVRSPNGSTFNEMITSEELEMVSTSTMLYQEPEFYFDKGVMDMAPRSGSNDDQL
ncbi:hypothetical protein UCRPC4_g03419 [Phaeomoniella chlamydospora]|uniref:Putative transcription factor kapC n=1 Tax=Phaeomoniella chlamydospora TaxID=158046 RepID=A0A0G2EI91_PHACM|nr:hypothetical protein UCRPC4_g03419 [Phaeomoniella chlamydospora]